MMPHPAEHCDPDRPLGHEEAAEIAEAMRAFGSASRLRLLWALLGAERTVEELAAVAQMEQSAVSHQLRILRQLRLVAVRRSGRHAHYRLHDHHVADLLAAIRHHREHVNPAATLELPESTPRSASTGARRSTR